jgi:hypothetical protein
METDVEDIYFPRRGSHGPERRPRKPEMVAQCRTFICSPEQPTTLQFRHDKIDEIFQTTRQVVDTQPDSLRVLLEAGRLKQLLGFLDAIGIAFSIRRIEIGLIARHRPRRGLGEAEEAVAGEHLPSIA